MGNKKAHMKGGYATYDIFDVTVDKIGFMVGQLHTGQDDYMLNELIELAIEEINPNELE